MVGRRVDPAKLAGAELERWYRRTPDEIERERRLGQQALYDDFFFGEGSRHEPGAAGQRNLAGGEGAPNRVRATDQANVALERRQSQLPEVGGGSWQEAQFVQPRARTPPSPPRPPPASARRRPDAQLRGPVERAPSPVGAFFDQAGVVPNPNLGPAYYSDLPRPLNVVEPQQNGWFRLSDGSVVQADELERLHAEQQRMMQGTDEFEPAQHVRSADRLKDGFIPRADQLAKEDRELDATCHPYGGWELDRGYPHYSTRTQRYEAQITRAPGLDYVVRTPDGRVVKFDGCAVWDPRRRLLEAKGLGLADLAEDAERYPFMRSPVGRATEQVGRQLGVAQGRPVDWHAAERRFRDRLRRALGEPPAPSPTFSLQHTPAR